MSDQLPLITDTLAPAIVTTLVHDYGVPMVHGQPYYTGWTVEQLERGIRLLHCQAAIDRRDRDQLIREVAHWRERAGETS